VTCFGFLDFWAWVRHDPFQDMAQNPKRSGKNEQGEYAKFTTLLDRLLSVPHEKIKAKLDAEKADKQARPKRASSGHAFGEKN
jgi:hypothetical protein